MTLQLTGQELHLACAVGTEGEAEAVLRFCNTVPSFPNLDAAHAFYAQQAERLATLLEERLPGGTLHALLVELLQRKAALLAVPTR